jgi:hypothetical protein
MARLVALSFLLAGAASSGPSIVLHGYGMSITIPPGWSLARDSALRSRRWNSLHIRRSLIGNNFEGLPRGIGLYRATVRRSAYDIDLWVFLKTVRPAQCGIARAQAELDRLRLPAWPAG